MDRTFVVGDIHGWHKPLVDLLQDVSFDYDKDTLISVGDIADRGPDVYLVVEELMKIKNKVLIQGNHDIWFKSFLKTGHIESHWWNQGGDETHASYKRRNWANKKAHISFFDKQVPFSVINNKCFVHGGFDRNLPIAQQSAISLAWDRELVNEAMLCLGKREVLRFFDKFYEVFIGHTPTIYWDKDDKLGGGLILPTRTPITEPIYAGGVWNVDTGCGKGGPLTIMDIDTKKFWQRWPKYYE